MNTLNLTPLYANNAGFEPLASVFDKTLFDKVVSDKQALNSDFLSESSQANCPPYNIEMLEENNYAISLSVPGFQEKELEIKVDQGVLSISGNKTANDKRQFLHQGITNASFESKFKLAEFIEVRDANLAEGLLSIKLKKEIPETMKPKTIAINQNEKAIEHDDKKQ